MGEVIFTVRDKLLWQDAMCFDRDLSSTAFRVGFAIGWHINKHTGIAFVAMETIAARLGIVERTVWGAIKELERRGHLKVHRREIGTRKTDGRAVCGGRQANRYEPMFRRTQPVASFDQDDPADRTQNLASLGVAERTQNSEGKDAKSREKGRSGLRPYPYTNPFINPKTRARDPKLSPITAAADRLIEQLGGGDQRPHSERHPANNPNRQSGPGLRLGEFEILVADRMSITHATLIERCSGDTITKLHRKFRAGVNIMPDIEDLLLKISTTERLEAKRSTDEGHDAERDAS